MDQASVGCPEELYPVVVYVMSFLDENGYIRASMNDILLKGNYDCLAVEQAISYIQCLEPAGVGARDLAECLLLQLSKQDNVARYIVENHLEDLAKSRISHLAKMLGVSIEEIDSAVARIRKLNPKPGNGFGNSKLPMYTSPDIIVTSFQNQFYILPCEYSYPTINLNRYYSELIRYADDKEVEKYIDTKIKQALWVQQCIENRMKTLVNVAKAIVQHQERFFRYGPQNMSILRMSEIAQMLDLHESTVSRAVKNKYIQCSHGVFPMKHFFVQGARTLDGFDGASSHEIKSKILAMINEEDKMSPLSDQQISTMLTQQGIHLARRTVSKYREQMQILSSAYRRYSS